MTTEDTKSEQTDEDTAATGDATESTTQTEQADAPDIEAIVAKRVARERKAWEKEQAVAAERAKMTEAEQAKADKAEAERAAAEKTSAADRRIVRADTKLAAVAAGVKPDRVDAFLRIVDTDGIEVDDDGDADAKAIKAAVAAALDIVPEFATGDAKPAPSGVTAPKPANAGGGSVTALQRGAELYAARHPAKSA